MAGDREGTMNRIAYTASALALTMRRARHRSDGLYAGRRRQARRTGRGGGRHRHPPQRAPAGRAAQRHRLLTDRTDQEGHRQLRRHRPRNAGRRAEQGQR
ncbi:hypothetical protein ACRAWD_17635 [Caulobacter segnis]